MALRDTWYADNRDLVKWGTLAHIAQREGLDLIVQVPYLRCGDRAPLHAGNGEVSIASPIWEFFRNVSAVAGLGESLGREIVVIGDAFEPSNRTRYRKAVVDRLHNLCQPKVVLLDPDTGIAPTNASANHATPDDVQAVWHSLGCSDWLVLYQHASRNKSWKAEARRKFAAACGVENCEMFAAPDIAWDVVFFACAKRDSCVF